MSMCFLKMLSKSLCQQIKKGGWLEEVKTNAGSKMRFIYSVVSTGPKYEQAGYAWLFEHKSSCQHPSSHKTMSA